MSRPKEVIQARKRWQKAELKLMRHRDFVRDLDRFFGKPKKVKTAKT
jgi:hypothetical protein